jgi:lysophospholipase L1-like esterase
MEVPASDAGLPGIGPLRRYDWFKDLWKQRRGAWSHQIAADQGAVVFFGDSITQGWGDTLGGNFPGLKVANRGIAGDTTRGLLLRLEQDVLALKPKGIVLLIGTNDLEEDAKPEVPAANLRWLLERVRAHDAKLPVLLCEVFPSSAEKKRPAAKIRRVNELYAELVTAFPQVTIVPTWSIFANEQGDATLEEFPDLLHPNEKGYAKWAAALKPALKRAGLGK